MIFDVEDRPGQVLQNPSGLMLFGGEPQRWRLAFEVNSTPGIGATDHVTDHAPGEVLRRSMATAL